MKKDVSIRGEGSRYILIGIIAVTIVAAIAYSLFTNNRMVKKYSLLVDAGMEVKFEITTAHLWFEEIMSGDKSESFDDVIKHIELAGWYAEVMLEGGTNPRGTYIPLSDPLLRKEVQSVVEQLEEFKQITVKRHLSFESAGVGTEIDQQYDWLFHHSIDQIDHVERLLQQKISKDISRYQLIQFCLMLAIIVMSFLIGLIQYRHDRAIRENLLEIAKERDRAEKSEGWLKTTMNSMGDGVIVTDHTGNVTYLNPVASSLTGWRLDDAKKRRIEEIFTIVNEQTKEPVANPINMVIRKNVVVGLANHTELISKDGTRWPIADSAAPIFDHKNDLVGVVIVFHEVSEQKKAEAEKAKLEAQLRQAFKMEAIGTMAGGIAHDFNNILAVIIGNADMAIDDVPDGNPARHNIDQVLIAASRAKELVKQILSFSRRDESKKAPSYLCRLVEESMKSLRSTIPTTVKIDLLNICRDHPAECKMILADPTQIHQLLLNLCVNAVQAMDERGVLEINLNEVSFEENIPADRAGLKPGNYEYLSVSDTGSGMTPEVVAQIFDPFFTTKEVDKGTGMGLSVVHGIVEGHHGKIFVESEPGKGTTFHIYFPITEKTPEEKPEEYGALPTGNERILYVDDDSMLAGIGKELIEGQGYSVSVKTDSVEALELFKNDPAQFDLVITDQTMPNIAGADLAKQLLQLRPDLPIILCTGYSSKVDKVKAKQIGIREFASKPLNRRDIAILIRKVLDGE